MASTFPQQIDIIPLFMDLTNADMTNVNNFQNAMNSGDFNKANQYLNLIENANQKIINASRLNKLRDAVLALEEFYKDDIEDYVSQKQAEWLGIINRFNYMDIYLPYVAYQVNNIVRYTTNGEENLYIKTDPSAPNNPPTDKRYWRKLTIKGERGINSNGETTFYFDWQSAQTYNTNAIVSYADKWWIAKKITVGNPPQEGSEYWDMIMSSMQSLYPVSSSQPDNQNVGELWFEVI